VYAAGDTTSADIVVTSVGQVVGSQVVYTITITNAGPDLARVVRAGDLLKTDNAAYVSYTVTVGTCAFDAVRRLLKCTLGDMNSGDSVTITLTADIVGAGTIVNGSAALSPQTHDPNLHNNIAIVRIPQ